MSLTPSTLPPTPVAAGRAADKAQARLTAAYGWFLRWLFGWAFSPVRVPEETAAKLQGLAERGTVVYVGRSAAVITFLYFQQLYVRLGAPIAHAVLGLAVSMWEPWGRFIGGRLPVRAPGRDDVAGAVLQGHSAMVFLRKSGSLAGQIGGMKDPFPDLIAAQRKLDRPIFLIPQLLIWERRPRHLRRNLLDVIFGEVEAPGFFRSVFVLLWNRQRAFVKLAEPIDLKKMLEESHGIDDAIIARKIRGAIGQHLARETRVVLGPPLKDPERIIEETLRERTLRATLAEVARERGRADGSVEKEAEKDLREIAARYSPRMIDFMRWMLDFVFNRIYDGITVDEEGLKRVAAAAADAPIVICPSHKSHIDYLLLSYVFYVSGLTTPHIAAGINLAFWPVGTMFRKSGAFFIRRSFKDDKVYSAVLKAYVRKLLRDGFSQEFFIEGGRSRTGKVLSPRFGMLSMEVDAWLDGVQPDVFFIPTSTAYERIIEAKSYAHELAGGEKHKEDFGQLLRARKVLTSRYGRIHLRFDQPVSLAELARQRNVNPATATDDQKRALVKALGFRIIEGVNRASALTPSALLCTALLSHDRRGLTAPELIERMEFLLKLAVDAGGRLAFERAPGALDPQGDGPVHEALHGFEQEKSIVVQKAGAETIYSVPDSQRVTLDYHKNSSIHFYVADALFATALLTTASWSRADIEARTLALSRHFKQEFIYGAGSFSQLFGRRVTRFIDLGLITETDGQLVPLAAGHAHTRLLADLLVSFVEAYAAANDALSLLLKAPLDRKELIKLAMERNRAAGLAGKIRRFESVSKVTLENALDLFEEQGILLRTGEKGRQRALAPAINSQEAIDARVAEMRSFLIPPGD